MKSFSIEDKDPFMVHNQYHGFYWASYIRIQGISTYDFDLVILEYSVFNTKVDALGQ